MLARQEGVGQKVAELNHFGGLKGGMTSSSWPIEAFRVMHITLVASVKGQPVHKLGAALLYALCVLLAA